MRRIRLAASFFAVCALPVMLIGLVGTPSAAYSPSDSAVANPQSNLKVTTGRDLSLFLDAGALHLGAGANWSILPPSRIDASHTSHIQATALAIILGGMEFSVTYKISLNDHNTGSSVVFSGQHFNLTGDTINCQIIPQSSHPPFRCDFSMSSRYFGANLAWNVNFDYGISKAST
jgi:hypothetical protein